MRIVASISLAMYGLAAASTSSTSPSTCTVTSDLASSVMALLQDSFGSCSRSLNAMTSIAKNQMNNSIVPVPTPGAYSTQWAAQLFNASISVVTYGLFHQVDFLQWADSDGFTLLYGVYNPGTGLEAYGGQAPVSPNIATTCTTYNCYSTLYYYHVNTATGKPTSITPFKTGSYPTSQRPFFWPMTVNSDVSYTFYYSTFSTVTLVAFGMPYYTNVVSPTFTDYKTATSFLVVEYISDAIAEINKDAANTVGYVMTNQAPFGLLVATSIGEKCNMTTFAADSTNAYIRSSSQYILDNNIVTDTAAYVDSLGCYLNVQFFTYGATTPTTVSPPAGLPSTSTYQVYSSTGIKWIVVSCTVESNPSTTTTFSNDDGSSSSGGGATLVLVALIFIMLLIASMYALFICLNNHAGAAHSDASIPSASAPPAVASEVTSSPMASKA